MLFATVQGLHAGSVFDFEADALGTYTSFTDVSNGISATFTSNGDPGGFQIYPTFFQDLTGNILLNPGFPAPDGLTLTVQFSSLLSAATLDFGLNSQTSSDTFTLSAYNGSTLVGSDTEVGLIPPELVLPEGVAGFSGASFDSIMLTSTALDFAVDNIAVNAASAPEPGTMTAVGFVVLLGGVILYRRRTSIPQV